MKIIKIKIDNFKTFDSEEIIVNEHLNYFVGINGVGKSNFLKAIEIFGNDETDFNKNAKDNDSDINISFELQLNPKDIESIIKLVIEDWLNYLIIFLNDFNDEIKPEKNLDIFENVGFSSSTLIPKRILSKKFVQKYQLGNIDSEINFSYLWSYIHDDFLKIKECNWENHKEFVKRKLKELINQFENKNLILIKRISKEEKPLFLVSNVLDILNNIICDFSDVFILKTLDNGKIFFKSKTNEKKNISWLSIFWNYKNNNTLEIGDEKYFKIDLRKLINIFVWNNNSINFNVDLRLAENINNDFLNNLLKNVDMNVLSLIEENKISIIRKESELNKRINTFMSKYWRDFKNEDLEMSIRISNESINFILKNKEIYNHRELTNESDGFKQFLSIMLSLDFSANNSNTILIIDEPEIHLHPSSVISLRNMLNEASKNYLNFFIATHSVNMIDKDNLQTLNLVTKQYQNTKITNLLTNDDSIIFPNIIKQAFGTDIFSEFIFKKYTFFVEGRTDKVFLEKYFKEYKISANILIYYGSKGIDFINNMKDNFYDEYFEDNCFFISDADNEGKEIKTKFIKVFRNIKAFTLLDIIGEDNSTIEYLYSKTLFEQYEEKKKMIEEKWGEIENKKSDMTNHKWDKEKAKSKNYKRPLFELKKELSEKVKNEDNFAKISNPIYIEKFTAFLNEHLLK
ncbi:MAG: AAA family ATPase [Mycoplasmataceae bacterium]|nr:AAA family ATPase [Mycoplasmataceae bacterium]